MDIQIRRAQPDEAATLTEIAHAAKRLWGYPESWIEHWKDELTITPDFIANNEVYVALAGHEIAGCCALVLRDSQAELEHLWIRPAHMGNGVGRALFQRIVARAAQLNIAGLEISSDPNAEGFYQRMGAKRIGEIQSEIDGHSRALPRMSIDLESARKKELPGWIKN